MRLLGNAGVLEADCDIVDVVQDAALDRHEQLHQAAAQDRSAVWLNVLDLQLGSCVR